MKIPELPHSLVKRLAVAWDAAKLALAQQRNQLPLTLWPQPGLVKQTLLQFALIFGGFAAIILLGNHYVVQQRQQHEIETLKLQQNDTIDSIQRLFTDRLATGLQDILFIKDLPEMEEYTESLQQEPMELLGLDLIGLMQLREDYDKIRIIDAKGMEVMHVCYTNNVPRPLPKNELRDKRNSAYYKVGLKLKPGEVYISPFELNKVHGQVEIPHNPTFRLVYGIFDKKEKLVAMIVINYLGNNLLKELDARTSEWLSLWMMSEDGCWIKEPGKEFESEPAHTTSLLERLGPVRPIVTSQTSGQTMTPHGLCTFRHFNPLQLTLDAHPRLARRLKVMQSEKIDNWIVVSHISPAKLRQITQFFDSTNTLILVLILTPGAVGAWFLSQALVLRRESERKSKEARDTLQHITDSIPGAVFKLNLDREGSGDFLFVSRGTRDIFGLSQSDPMLSYGQFLNTIIPSDRKEYDNTLLEAVRSGAPWGCDFRIYDGNSCLKWIRSSSKVTRNGPTHSILSGIFTDVTSLKVAEIKRHTSEERLDLALQATNDGLWDWNVAEGSIYFSARWLQMIGYETHELPHHFNTWKSLLHPDDLKPTLKMLSFNIENKSNHFEMEYRLRTKTGGWKWILTRGAVVQRDPLGRPERMIGTHTDISERKDLEKSLKEAKDTAEQASKTKSTFLAIMSHELRTPMNSVCGFADSLKHTALNEEQSGYVDKIEKSAGKLLFIINDILDYSKIEAGRLKLEAIAFDILHTIREACDMLRPQLEEKQIQFELQIDGPSSLTVLGDPVRLHQIIVNLLANAIKFTDKGSISVNLHTRPTESGACEVEISVKDSGIGMSVEQQSVLFQPFSQVDNSTTRKYGGTGLGLAICKRLCEMMNGHIWVVSQPGQGSTFTFSVCLEPAAPTNAAPPPTVRKTSADTNRSRVPLEKFSWKVLLADHDPVSRMVATELLHEIGCEVEVIDSTATSLPPDKFNGCTALILDETAMKSGLFRDARQQVQQLGIRPFYCFGLSESPVKTAESTDSVDAWINQPVDIRNLSRTFSKVAKEHANSHPSLAALQ